MDRRGFIGSILAACAAPAIVRADSLMRIVPAESLVLRGANWLTKTDLLFAGAIREIWQYDIQRDITLTRFDVIGRNRYGRPIQLGVDLSSPHGGHPSADERAIALHALRCRARDGGLIPITGVLQIPGGVQGRYL